MNTAVIGSRGYLGRELVRLLSSHPDVDTIHPSSSSEAGSRYSAHVPGFHGTDLRFTSTEEAIEAADVVFFATEHGVAKEHAASCGDRFVVDLSRDHRLEAIAGTGDWVYSLADVEPAKKGSRRIANPGCYPTATMLAAAPAIKAGLTDGMLIVDGKSGVSGAGATPRADLHYAATNESVRAYKVTGHDHQAEMAAMASHLAGRQTAVRFTPHLVPLNRGLLSTVYLPTEADTAAVHEAYEAFYEGNPFVHTAQEPMTGSVTGTNHVEIAADVDQGIIIARSAIDNLRKGGSGQAIQNMNHALGLDPTLGLLSSGGNP